MLVCTGCSSSPAEAPQPRILCAAIAPHTRIEQSVLAAELPDDGPESRRWLEEYVALRLACRAAAKAAVENRNGDTNAK